VKAATIWKSLNDGGALAYALVLAAQNQALLVAKVQASDPDMSNTRKIEVQAAARKTLKFAQDAKGLAEAIGEQRTLASAYCAITQAEVFVEKYNQALDAVEEALKICRQLQDHKFTANTLILSARTRLVAGSLSQVPDEAAEALSLFQFIKDSKGELLALNLLQQIKDLNLEVRERPRMEIAAPRQDVSGYAPAPTGAAVTPAAAGAPALSEALVYQQIQDVTKRLIGGTKDVDVDKPLMEAGVTSMTAILYRQHLSEAIDGIHFPPTLVFDYPTIEAIADFVLEEGNRLGDAMMK